MSTRATLIGAVVALAGFGGAQAAHAVLVGERAKVREDEPFAPSPESAPFVSLGYREVAADLLFVRMIGYFGGGESTANGIASLAEAIATLDPDRYRVYEFGARAMTLAKFGVDQHTFERAIALLERGRAWFPPDWRMPYLEGQIYTQDLQTTDPAQRRAWDEKGTLLVESAIRKPHAPSDLATWASVMRTRMGQYDRAVTGLREMLLVSHDDTARANILAKLAELEDKSGDELADELLAARADFEAKWKAERPALPETMYLLLGARPSPRIDMAKLATGGRDLFDADEAPLAPPTDP